MENDMFIENVEPKNPVELRNLIPLEKGSIVSKILAQNDAVSITLFSFGKGQEISTHQSDGDALVSVLEGEGTFVVDGEPFVLKAGQSLLMPHHHPHAVKASSDFKMLLTVVFPLEEAKQ
jgi:quercetin dioxygenase-like cupin family protein